MNKDQSSTVNLKELTDEGRELVDVARVEPIKRDGMDCDGVLEVMTIVKSGSAYTISANLHRAVTVCPHCGSANLKMHGRFLIHLADLPYIDPQDVPHPVAYSITAQRYLCDGCGKGVAEPLPESLAPAVKTSRITRRLSCWLMYMLQTDTPYEHIALAAGYSKVWLRKWYTEIRGIYGLGAKPCKPGRKPKEASLNSREDWC